MATGMIIGEFSSITDRLSSKTLEATGDHSPVKVDLNTPINVRLKGARSLKTLVTPNVGDDRSTGELQAGTKVSGVGLVGQ